VSISELRSIIKLLDENIMHLTSVEAIARAIEERDECETTLGLAIRIAKCEL
jgi:hypothetical protein